MGRTKTIKTDRLTRDMVRDIQLGESVIYVLPSYSAIESAKVTLSHMKKITGSNFTCNLTGENIITVTRHE